MNPLSPDRDGNNTPVSVPAARVTRTAPGDSLPSQRDIDAEIDRYFGLLSQPHDAQLIARYAQKFTALVRKRNESRTPDEIEELETERGMRSRD